MNRTSQYIKMVIFILALGAVAAGLLVGIDALTKDRIERNKLYELYSAILDANGDTDYNSNNFVDIFNERTEKAVPLDATTDIVVYQHLTTKNYSFQFSGNGMWGPIKGVLTLEEDFLTIVAIKILEQEETPGLGARIAEDKYLVGFKGLKFPNITILKDKEPVKNNEIGGLTGATTTTGRFQVLLNNAFNQAFTAYMGDALEQAKRLEILAEMLEVHGVEVLEDSDVLALVAANFDVFESGDLVAYVNNSKGLVSFIYEEEIRFGQNLDDLESIPIIITLRDDIETIENITAIYADNDGHWGKTKFLDLLEAKGAKFPNLVISESAGNGGIINSTDATKTRADFVIVVNRAYDTYLPLLQTLDITAGEYEDEALYTFYDIQKIILEANDYDLEGMSVADLFEAKIKVVGNGDVQVYADPVNRTVSFYVETQMRFGILNDQIEDVLVVVTIEEDGVTIKNVAVIYKDNEEHEAKEILFNSNSLLAFVGTQFPNIEIVSVGGNANEVVIYNSKYVTTSSLDFEKAFNMGYSARKAIIDDLDYDVLMGLDTILAVLSGHGYNINQTPKELKALYDQVIDEVVDGAKIIYVNKDSNKVTFYFNEDLKFGVGTDIIDNVGFYVTLASDFKTILKVSALHDGAGNQWGKVRLLIEEVLNNMINMEFPNIDLLTYGSEDEKLYLGVARVTTTGSMFEDAINEWYDDYLPMIESNFTINHENGLTLVTNNVSNNVSFYFTKTLMYGNQNNEAQKVQQSTKIFVSLENDYETIINITATFPAGTQWGKTRLLTNERLANAVGMKFPNLDIKVFNEDEGRDAYLGLTNITATGSGFEDALNEYYDIFKNTFWGSGS